MMDRRGGPVHYNPCPGSSTLVVADEAEAKKLLTGQVRCPHCNQWVRVSLRGWLRRHAGPADSTTVECPSCENDWRRTRDCKRCHGAGRVLANPRLRRDQDGPRIES